MRLGPVRPSSQYLTGEEPTKLLLIRLQNKAARTLRYDKAKTTILLGTKFEIYQTYFNCQLPNSCTLLING